MKLKRLIQILSVGLEYLEDGINCYICDSIQEQWIKDDITEEEWDYVKDWLDENKPAPQRHETFFNHPHYIEGKEHEKQQIGWWRSSSKDECLEQRILFMRHLISELKGDLSLDTPTS